MDLLFSKFKKNPLLAKLCFYILIFFLTTQNLLYFDYCAHRMIFPLMIAVLALITSFPAEVFNKEIKKEHKITALILSVPLLFIFFFYITGIKDPVTLFVNKVFGPLQTAIFICAMAADLILAYWIGLVLSFSLYGKFKKRLFGMGAVIAALTFITVIYLPLDSYIANIENFEFTCVNFIFYYFLFFLSLAVVMTLVLVRVKDKRYLILYKALLAIVIGSFVQYMFLNKHLPYLGLTNKLMVWDVPVLMINTLVWIVIFVAVFLAPKLLKDKFEKTGNAVSVIIFSYHVVSLILMFVLAPSSVFTSKVQYYFDSSQQYTVSSNNNVIVIVFDAYDNKDMVNLANTDQHKFDQLKDFTMYTNTASMFDSTVTSVNQFCGGCDYNPDYDLEEWLGSGWNSDRTIDFYDSMHKAGYKCNAYNFEISMLEFADGKFDNLVKYDKPIERKVEVFDLNKFYEDFQKLSLYRSMPYLVKNLVSLTLDRNAFHFYVSYSLNDTSIYNNSAYLANQKYETIDDNVFMFNHLSGVHAPCDYVPEQEYCFQIMYNLIAQFQEMGIYDNSTIIFMSDHGSHRDGSESAGSSPIFIIKEPGISKDSITLNDSPIYLSDFIGTVAVNAGLNDPEQYGSSVYDFSEGDQRERIVYERLYDESLPIVYSKGHLSYRLKYNAFAKYVITGRVSDIEGINPFEDDSIEIIPMKECFG